jgi:hypothetical protein
MVLFTESKFQPCLVLTKHACNQHIPMDHVLQYDSAQAKASTHQKKFNKMRQCVNVFHLEGKHNVLTNNNHSYNISFQSNVGLGPATLHLHLYPINVQGYDKSITSYMIQDLQLYLEDGRPFHPQLPTKHVRLTPGPIHWQYKSRNLVTLHIKYRLHIGIPYIMSIHMNTHAFCTPQSSLTAIHNQQSNHMLFQVIPPSATTGALCREDMADLLSQSDQKYMNTEVIIRQTFKKRRIFVQLMPNSILYCKPLETFTIYESHPDFNLLYKYIYNNTAGLALNYNGTMHSDLHLFIRKIYVQNDNCTKLQDTYKRVLLVAVGSEQQIDPANQHQGVYNHYPAR